MDPDAVIAAISALAAVFAVLVASLYGRRQANIAASARDTAQQALANARTATAMTVRQTELAEKARDDADAPDFDLGELELRATGWTLPFSMIRGPICDMEIRADIEYQTPIEGFEAHTRWIVQGGDFWLEWLDTDWVPGSKLDLELDIGHRKFSGDEVRVDATISVRTAEPGPGGRRWSNWVRKRTWTA